MAVAALSVSAPSKAAAIGGGGAACPPYPSRLLRGTGSEERHESPQMMSRIGAMGSVIVPIPINSWRSFAPPLGTRDTIHTVGNGRGHGYGASSTSFSDVPSYSSAYVQNRQLANQIPASDKSYCP